MKIIGVIFLVLSRILKMVRRRWRGFYGRCTLKSIGKQCEIADGVLFFGRECITLGSSVILNEGVILQSCDGAEICVGNRVVFSYGSTVITGGLSLVNGINFEKHISSSIIIEDDVWVGAKAIILPGVTIKKGSVIAAGSVVVNSVDEGVLVSGVPSKFVKYI